MHLLYRRLKAHAMIYIQPIKCYFGYHQYRIGKFVRGQQRDGKVHCTCGAWKPFEFQDYI